MIVSWVTFFCTHDNFIRSNNKGVKHDFNFLNMPYINFAADHFYKKCFFNTTLSYFFSKIILLKFYKYYICVLLLVLQLNLFHN